MIPKHKGDELEQRSKRLLFQQEPDSIVLEGKSVGGFDLIQLMPFQDTNLLGTAAFVVRLVEVTTPANRSRARKKLATIPDSTGIWKTIHLWKKGSKIPRIINIEDGVDVELGCS